MTLILQKMAAPRLPLVEIPENIRHLQQVSTLSVRKSVILWMIEDEALRGREGLNARTIQQFPEHFRGHRSSNLVKANRWWQQRHDFMNDEGAIGSTSCSRGLVKKRMNLYPKARAGRGQKRSPWVQYLYPRILDTFEQYRIARVKFSAKLLRALALLFLTASDSEYNIHSVDSKDSILLVTKINNSWVQQFMDSQNVVILSQRGRLVCSPSKELHIEMKTAYHMRVLHRGFCQEFFKNIL